MKRLLLAIASVLLLTIGPVVAADGLITVESGFNTKQTIDRLEAALKAGGATIFARIDHAAGAASVDMKLRPTELLIFGNPKGGTPLLQAQQTIGIDLPLKALAWEDAAGKVWLSYNDPAWLAQRHGSPAGTTQVTDALAAALKAASAKATTAP